MPGYEHIMHVDVAVDRSCQQYMLSKIIAVESSAFAKMLPVTMMYHTPVTYMTSHKCATQWLFTTLLNQNDTYHIAKQLVRIT